MIDEIIKQLNIPEQYSIFIENCLQANCEYVGRCCKYLQYDIDTDVLLDRCNNDRRHIDLPLHKKFQEELFYRSIRKVINDR